VSKRGAPRGERRCSRGREGGAGAQAARWAAGGAARAAHSEDACSSRMRSHPSRACCSEKLVPSRFALASAYAAGASGARARQPRRAAGRLRAAMGRAEAPSTCAAGPPRDRADAPRRPRRRQSAPRARAVQRAARCSGATCGVARSASLARGRGGARPRFRERPAPPMRERAAGTRVACPPRCLWDEARRRGARPVREAPKHPPPPRAGATPPRRSP